MNCSRSASASVLRNSVGPVAEERLHRAAAPSGGARRSRPAGGPPVASVRCSRMQVRTSSSARPGRLAWRTPLVATAGRPSASARSSSVLVRRLLPPPAVALHVDARCSPRRRRAARAPGDRCRAGARASRRPGSATRPSTARSSSSASSDSVAVPFALSAFMSRDQAAEVAVALRLSTSSGRAPPPSSESEAPTSGRMPAARAALKNRGAPETPSRSTRATAGSRARPRARPGLRGRTTPAGTRTPTTRGARRTWMMAARGSDHHFAFVSLRQGRVTAAPNSGVSSAVQRARIASTSASGTP